MYMNTKNECDLRIRRREKFAVNRCEYWLRYFVQRKELLNRV